MVIMSEWVYGNGKRQRRGEEVSNVFSVKLCLGSADAASSSSVHLSFFFSCRLTIRVAQTLSAVCLQEGTEGRVSFLSCNSSDADVERVVSVMNDAGGMSPVSAEVFISSY